MTLEVVFSGLVALVREQCTVHPTNPSKLHILMMKGEGSGGMKHQPRLIVESTYAGPTNEASEIIDVGNGTAYLVWDLTGYRVDLDQVPPSIGVLEGRRGPNSRTPASGDQEDLSWVPDLHRACGVDAADLKIKADAFKQDTLPSYVTARFADLSIIKTNSPNAENALRALHDHGWSNKSFDFPGKSYNQSLADRVSLTMKLKYTNYLTLKLTPLDGRLPAREVHLRPPQVGQRAVVVSVTNLPSMQEVPGDTVDHFRYYFDLAQDSTANCVIPKRGGLGAAPVKCTLCGSCGPGLGP
jgi:hypothetical protein